MRSRIPVYAISAFAAGLFAYAAFLLALAPATLFDAGLRRIGDGRMRLAEARGTLWSGTGRFEIRAANGKKGIGRNVSWQFLPRSLLHGRVDYEVGIALAKRHFLVSLSPLGLFRWQLTIADAEFALPAAALGLAVPKLALVGPTGDLLVHISGLSLAEGAMSGNVVVQWNSAGSSLTPISPLGDYELRFTGDDKGMSVFLRTVKGPLWLVGHGSIQGVGRPAFFATARVDAPYESQLDPFLRLIAIERSKGNFELQLNQVIGPAGAATGPAHE